MTKQQRFTAGATLLSVFTLAFVAFAQSKADSPTKPPEQSELRQDMRKLWEEHTTWTRLYIVSALADLPDKAATAERLMQNQADIGKAIQAVYGEAAGSKLTALLQDHIKIAVELIDAAKAGDAAEQGEITKRWGANADDIAAFLSQANPKYWPAAEMKTMMHEHLDLTTAEVVARLEQDWSADIAAYDRVHEQILKMADMLSAGILAHAPGGSR